jgi:hypothetical protein
MAKTTVYVFRHRRQPGRGRWRILKYAALTLGQAQRAAAGWRATGAEVEILPAEIEARGVTQPANEEGGR